MQNYNPQRSYEEWFFYLRWLCYEVAGASERSNANLASVVTEKAIPQHVNIAWMRSVVRDFFSALHATLKLSSNIRTKFSS